MDSVKIENFAKSHSLPFPWYRHLTTQEASDIRSRLTERTGVLHESDIGFTKHVLRQARPYEAAMASAEDFSLASMVNDLGIAPEPTAFVNWYRFDDIDELHFSDLSSYFDDIWYPSSDDIDIFDSSLRWMISVDHHGRVRVARWQ